MTESIEAILVFNFTIALLSVWACSYIYAKHYKPAKIINYRFRLYALRDRLTLLVMRGIIDKDSVEYDILLRLINAAIVSVGTFRVTDFLRFVGRISRNRRLQGSLNEIRGRIEAMDNKEYTAIASEFFDITREIFKRNSRYFLIIAPFFQVLFYFFGPKESIKRREAALRRSDRFIKEQVTNFQPVKNHA